MCHSVIGMVRGQELGLWSGDQGNGTEVAAFEPTQCGRAPRGEGRGACAAGRKALARSRRSGKKRAEKRGRR